MTVAIICSTFCVVIFGQYRFVVIWHDLFHVWHASVTYFSVFLLSIVCTLFVGGKHVSNKLRNCLPMLNATCLLYGGLNHVMFLFLLFFCLVL